MGLRWRRCAAPGRGRNPLKLLVLAWGRAGRSPEAEIADRYLKRIGWGARLVELADRASPPVAAPTSRTVALDERGEPMSSPELARLLGGWRDAGVREARFLIGPHDGLDDEARAGTDRLLAFGRATWPHLLVRAMLAEQLYRAVSICEGHPYHRG